MAIGEVASVLNLTDRRIRQMTEQGAIPRHGRGCVDIAWALYFVSGSRMVTDCYNKPRDQLVLVALGWLAGVGVTRRTQLTDSDLELLAGLFKRNGFTRDDALLAIGAVFSFNFL